MAQIGAALVTKLGDILRAPAGLRQGLANVEQANGLDLPSFEASQVIAHNVAADLAEKTAGARYPAFYVYCERLKNNLREKFRQYSGTAEMAIEVRVSQDRMEGLDHKMQLYTDAVTDVLDNHRGGWGNGYFYTGGYEVAFGPVKHGGKNFVQVAKVTFTLQVSI